MKKDCKDKLRKLKSTNKHIYEKTIWPIVKYIESENHRNAMNYCISFYKENQRLKEMLPRTLEIEK